MSMSAIVVSSSIVVLSPLMRVTRRVMVYLCLYIFFLYTFNIDKWLLNMP